MTTEMAERAEDFSGKAFVAGATGYTGREVVRVLLEKGVRVIAHIRPDSPKLDYWRRRFTKMRAEVDETPWEVNAMTESFKRLKPSYVFSLLGTTRARIREAMKSGKGKSSQDYEAVDYGLMALMVDALKRADIKPVFIYLSAAGTSEKSSSPYYRARFKAEQYLIKSGLPYIIARPSFIIGPDRDDRRAGEMFGARLIDILLSIAGFFGLKNFQNRYRSTTNTVLATALVRLALDADSVNNIFESENLRDLDVKS